jgi:multidrug resistance efflux pump
MRKWWPWPFGLALVLVAVDGLWAVRQPGLVVGKPSDQSSFVRTPLPGDTKVPRVVGGACLTTPWKEVTLRSDASRTIGTSETNVASPGGMVIKRVLVRHGERVRAGQILMELDDRAFVVAACGWKALLAAAAKDLEYRQEVLKPNRAVRKLEVARCETEVNYRTVDLDNRTKMLKAEQELANTRVVTQFDLFDIQSRKVEAEYSVAVAKDNLLRARVKLTIGDLTDQYDLAQAMAKRDETATGLALVRRSIDSCHLVSPLDGFVEKVDVVAAQVIQPGMALMEIVSLDPISVIMDFPAEHMAELAVGQKAEVVLVSSPKETFQGKVVALLPRVNPNTRTLPVYIELNNPGNRIKAGVSGFARVSSDIDLTTGPATGNGKGLAIRPVPERLSAKSPLPPGKG